MKVPSLPKEVISKGCHPGIQITDDLFLLFKTGFELSEGYWVRKSIYSPGQKAIDNGLGLDP